MKKDYSEHFLMDLGEVKDFVASCTDFFCKNAQLSSEELSDGNINYVYRVFEEKTGLSVVVKQADKFLRSSGRPLDVRRNKIEVEVLKIQGDYCPDFVPSIYYYSEAMCAVIMEDIGDFENLRYALIKGHVFGTLAQDISHFMAETLLPSTDLVLARDVKKLRVQNFTNIELCDISEDLVFTEPYYNYKNRNIVTAGQEDYVARVLYDDEGLHSEIAALRNNFMNNAQALIHGDLHSGSIFAKVGDSSADASVRAIKVIDPEFAFYGPMGYDIGNVVAHMIFALAHAMFCKKGEDGFAGFVDYATKTIVEIFDLTAEKFSNKYDEIVEFPLYKNVSFKAKYLADVMHDAVGYCGTEIIRRVVGDSKVLELTSVTDLPTKVALERCLIETGVELIKTRKSITSGAEIIALYTAMVGKNGI